MARPSNHKKTDKYNIIRNLDILEVLSDGQIVFVENMTIQTYNTRFFIKDEHNIMRKLLGLPEEWQEAIRDAYMETLLGCAIHIKCVHVDAGALYSSMRADREYYYFASEPNGCECGASFTSFPNHHFRWCLLYIEPTTEENT